MHQGHSTLWSNERYEAFVKAVTYLKAQGCTFMTVSELVTSRAEKK